MCGIAGILSNTPIDLRPIQAMTEIQSHRGPDSGALLFSLSSGAYRVRSDSILGEPIMGTLALGHRRLAIIDTSDNGIQPMHSAENGAWISYNGEIYNYRELRIELEQQGCHFYTDCDTEVILRAYEQWGVQCFQRFMGMWALAIYDPTEQVLVLSRDRFGIKPLYYTIQNERMAFASEIKALLELKDVPRSANLRAIKSYFTQHLVSHGTETFFDAVSAFPPAHYAIISLNTPLTITPTRYWEYPSTIQNIAYEEATERFRTLFDSAMQQHMRSDVPVGSCLSGGLDSSAIVCSADSMISGEQKPFHTFTAIFPDREIDESQWATAVNVQINASAHTTSPEAKDFLSELDALIWHQDEPFTSASMYAQWCVMREARKAGIPVLLDGQGADEILCGYKKFYMQHLKLLWKRKQYKELIRETLGFLRSGDRTIFRLRDASRYLPKRFRRDLSILDSIAREPLRNASPLPAPGFTSAETVQQRQIQDLQIFSLPSLLRFEDRNSMAFSVESRVPFLDHRLVEFCLTLPVHMKMQLGTTKRIMRDALEKVIPKIILDRRDKMGFGAPERRWLTENLLDAFIADMEQNRFALDAILDRAALLKAVTSYKHTPTPSTSRLLFQTFVLNRWASRFAVDFTV